MSTVRVDPDVLKALRAEAARDNVPVTTVANRAMRRGMGLLTPGPPRRVAGQRRPMDDPKTCRHPVNLRIGKQCAGCGSTV